MPVVGLLDGDLRDAIYQGFRGRLLSGALRRPAIPTSTNLAPNGDPLDSGYDDDVPIEGFNDQYSAFVRAQPGFPQTDLKLCIFGGSAPNLTPKANDLVRWDRPTGAQWFRLREGDGAIRVDPATALWECQALPVGEPL